MKFAHCLWEPSEISLGNLTSFSHQFMFVCFKCNNKVLLVSFNLSIIICEKDIFLSKGNMLLPSFRICIDGLSNAAP